MIQLSGLHSMHTGHSIVSITLVISVTAFGKMMELRCIEVFWKLQQEPLLRESQKLCWLELFALIVSQKPSHSFLSWASFHLKAITEIAESVHPRVWPAINVALFFLQRNKSVFDRAAGSWQKPTTLS